MCPEQYAGSKCSQCASRRWGPQCRRCPACVHGLCNSDNGTRFTLSHAIDGGSRYVSLCPVVPMSVPLSKCPVLTSVFFRFTWTLNGFWWNLGRQPPPPTDELIGRNCTTDKTTENSNRRQTVLPRSDWHHKFHSIYSILHPHGWRVHYTQGWKIPWYFRKYQNIENIKNIVIFSLFSIFSRKWKFLIS